MKKRTGDSEKRRFYVRALAGRASVYRMVGEYAKGIDDCREMLAHAVIPADRALALVDLASFICRKEHDYGEAKKLIGQATKSINKKKDSKIHARLLNQLGLIGIYEGTYDEARSIFLRMVSVCRKRGLRRRLLTAYFNLATLCHTKGELKDAQKYYLQCLSQARELHDLLRIGNVYSNLAILCRDRGDLKRALAYIDQCRTIFEEIGDRKGFAGASAINGTIHYFKAEFSKALDCYRRHLEISEEIGDMMGISIGSNNVGIVHAMRAELSEALRYYHQSLRIAERIGYKRGMCINYGNIGKIHFDRGELDRAFAFLEKKRDLSHRIGLERSTGESHIGIGRIKRKRGQLDEAYENLCEAEKILSRLNDAINLAEVYVEQSLLHNAQGKKLQAQKRARKALDLSKEIGAKRQVVCALRALGLAYREQDTDKALSFLDQSISLARKEKVLLELARSILSYAKIKGRLHGKPDECAGLKSMLEEAEVIFERAEVAHYREQLRTLQR
jgi:tetratricopeptide (TPR) repeat protein